MESYEEVMKKAERKYEHEQPLEAWEIILLLKKHANKGNAKAQFNLGVMYFMGAGVEQNYGVAIRWFKLSANQGNADAKFFLGEMTSICNSYLGEMTASGFRC